MTTTRPFEIAVDDAAVRGDLAVPENATAIVVFAHGSGSSRHSPRNRRVADRLQQGRLATLLVDLLSEVEEDLDVRTGHLRFDIELLAGRLLAVARWLAEQSDVGRLPLGYFGASTGAAAALVAAADPGGGVGAVVSRGGRPDLAGEALAHVAAPTLLIVGGRDDAVLELNRQAEMKLRCPHRLDVVPGATHLFEEPGTLDQVATLAAGWFTTHLASA